VKSDQPRILTSLTCRQSTSGMYAIRSDDKSDGKDRNREGGDEPPGLAPSPVQLSGVLCNDKEALGVQRRDVSERVFTSSRIKPRTDSAKRMGCNTGFHRTSSPLMT
jgi:hypothetical protein